VAASGGISVFFIGGPRKAAKPNIGAKLQHLVNPHRHRTAMFIIIRSMQAYTEKIWEHYLETNFSYLVATWTGFHVLLPPFWELRYSKYKRYGTLKLK